MRIDVLTLFPEMIEQSISHSIIARARETGALGIRTWNLRDFAHDRHRSVDDSPYGGGVGMVMKVEPIEEALATIKAQYAGEPPCVVLMSPQGERLTQSVVEQLGREPALILICGHYEGLDERVREHLTDREISIGDYVLTGGELPALVLLDAVARLAPGVLGKAESADEESFSSGLLEYPHYTRPEDHHGWGVPEILLSGHHAQIARWRRKEALSRTLRRRPDLLATAGLSVEDLKMLAELGASTELLQSLQSRPSNNQT